MVLEQVKLDQKFEVRVVNMNNAIITFSDQIFENDILVVHLKEQKKAPWKSDWTQRTRCSRTIPFSNQSKCKTCGGHWNRFWQYFQRTHARR